MADQVATFDVAELLKVLDKSVRSELASTPEVVDAGHNLDVGDLTIVARKWHRVTDVVAVVADLKSSTKLGTGKWAASTASIYQAATGSVVEIFDAFDADFLQIQGDGVFALFWGDQRYERAICAGITIKSFSEALVDRLEAKWTDLDGVTGYKIGIANSRLLVKKIGTPKNPEQQEPIWAGKAVNYATKAAQSVDRHELVVTGSVWDRIEPNDYLAFSCPCSTGPSTGIWADCTIARLPDNDPDFVGRKLSAKWCDVHGTEYCDAVMSGERKRRDTDSVRKSLVAAHFKSALWQKKKLAREYRRARQQGLAS